MPCEMNNVSVPINSLINVIHGARAAVLCESTLYDIEDAAKFNTFVGGVENYVWRSYKRDAEALFADALTSRQFNYVKDVIVGCIEVNPKINDGELVDVLSALGIQTY